MTTNADPQNQNGAATSKPLGSQAPAPVDRPGQQQAKPTPPAPVTEQAKTDDATKQQQDKPVTPPKGGPLVYVSSAEDVDKLLGDGKESNAVMPRSAIKKIKDKFEERGKAAGQDELRKQLEAQGFKSLEEALLAASEAKTLREAKKADASATDAAKADADKKAADKKRASFLPPRGNAAQAQTEIERKHAEAVREKNNAIRKREEAEAKLEAERADFAMRTELLNADVKNDDLDYVLDKLRLHIGGLDEKSLETFDTSKWLEEMKQGKPYLFKGTQVPATTGVSSPNNVPPAPKPGDVTGKGADENTVDARKMTPAQWRAHKEKLGIRKSF